MSSSCRPESLGNLTVCGNDAGFCLWWTHLSECVALVSNSLWHVSYSSVQEVSPESVWEDVLSVGVYSLAIGSLFRAMEEKNSIYGAMSYLSGNPELGFFPLCSQSPTLAPFAPCAKDVHGTMPTSAWPDLCLCGYREQIKWIVCMCSIFIANTNEKWAHPLPFGYSPFACFLWLGTTKFLF